MHSFDYLAGWALFFLGAWIAANGVDDLILDLAVLHRWLRGRARPSTRAALLRLDPLPRIAILVPCWQESEVIAQMLDHNLAAVDYPHFDFFVGAYPNDPATIQAVEAVQASQARVHVALCPHDGPTNKADCLNWAMQHLMLHEETRGKRFDMVVVHDAEDLIHPSELRWLAAEMQDAEMVQVPSFMGELIFVEMVVGFDHLPAGSFLQTTKSSSSSGPPPSRLVKMSSCSSAVSTGKYCMANALTVSPNCRGLNCEVILRFLSAYCAFRFHKVACSIFPLFKISESRYRSRNSKAFV